MSIVHKRATVHGPGPVSISLAESTQNVVKIRQVFIHCAVTFTDVCTMSIQLASHEGTAFDCVFKTETVATAAGVLQDVVWLPADTPPCLVGKDRVLITFGTASAALPWAYDVAIEV